MNLQIPYRSENSMTEIDIKLIILRHISNGNPNCLPAQLCPDISENVLRKVSGELVQSGFISATLVDEPEFLCASLTQSGKEFIKENTPQPIIKYVTSKFLLFMVFLSGVAADETVRQLVDVLFRLIYPK
jgi:hypothetical protein